MIKAISNKSCMSIFVYGGNIERNLWNCKVELKCNHSEIIRIQQNDIHANKGLYEEINYKPTIRILKSLKIYFAKKQIIILSGFIIHQVLFFRSDYFSSYVLHLFKKSVIEKKEMIFSSYKKYTFWLGNNEKLSF